MRRGAVVITMADLVDAELLELAIDNVRTLVAGTFLEGAPIVPFSSVTGQGKDELLAVIATFPDTARSTRGPVPVAGRSGVRAVRVRLRRHRHHLVRRP